MQDEHITFKKHAAYLFEEKLASPTNQLFFFMILLGASTSFFGSALYSLGGIEGSTLEDLAVEDAVWEAWNLVTVRT